MVQVNFLFVFILAAALQLGYYIFIYFIIHVTFNIVFIFVCSFYALIHFIIHVHSFDWAKERTKKTHAAEKIFNAVYRKQ